jgi:hypothetical protein
MVALLSSLGDVEKSHSLTFTEFLELHDCLTLESVAVSLENGSRKILKTKKGTDPIIAEETILRGLSAATEQELPQDLMPNDL